METLRAAKEIPRFARNDKSCYSERSEESLLVSFFTGKAYHFTRKTQSVAVHGQCNTQDVAQTAQSAKPQGATAFLPSHLLPLLPVQRDRVGLWRAGWLDAILSRLGVQFHIANRRRRLHWRTAACRTRRRRVIPIRRRQLYAAGIRRGTLPCRRRASCRRGLYFHRRRGAHAPLDLNLCLSLTLRNRVAHIRLAVRLPLATSESQSDQQPQTTCNNSAHTEYYGTPASSVQSPTRSTSRSSCTP